MKRLLQQSLLLLLAALGGACREPDNQIGPKKNGIAMGVGPIKDGGPIARPSDKGLADAKKAIERGELRLLGPPDAKWPEWHPEYRRLLKEKTGVDFQLDEERGKDSREWADHVTYMRTYADHWNATMETEIRNRFGANVLADLQAEAKKLKK